MWQGLWMMSPFGTRHCLQKLFLSCTTTRFRYPTFAARGAVQQAKHQTKLALETLVKTVRPPHSIARRVETTRNCQHHAPVRAPAHPSSACPAFHAAHQV
jgi:hypothetical protein